MPSALCPPGQQVELQLGAKLVRIYHRGALLKVHPRQPRGGRATDRNDYPAELSPYTLRAPEQLQRRAAELAEAAHERLLSRVVARYGRLDPLCLDEFGYVHLDPRGAKLLFQILTEREERASVAGDSNAGDHSGGALGGL